ncbi:hypothetical protein GCM10022402_04210 [Salinactinospora qingdaonensis]|uniref:Histidine kinase/HSP90-like ATPase domain-containing protein n=1 Tax=Salinactinospora qingdaonensis TaxID=702744 RepID=A0ABP7EWQ9_9ACTN
MPLVHAFLDTCAADRSEDYRYVFGLLGGELAANAIQHSRSGRVGGTFRLHARRFRDGMTLTCRDDGVDATGHHHGSAPVHLVPRPAAASTGHDPEAVPEEEPETVPEHGRGLALVDSLSTSWGDNGLPGFRMVWFHLADDLDGSDWPAA